MLEVIVMRGDTKLQKMARSLLKQNADVRDKRAEQSSGSMVPSGQRSGAFVTSVLAQGASVDPHNCERKVYDGNQRAALPGTLARAEGDGATGDGDVDRSYDGAGDVFTLYSKEFDRNSLDGNGMALVSTVHHRNKYGNAFWNGEQMAYGDGDGQIFTNFTELSIVGHEMSHGVVQHSGGLIYQGQSGALNESYADVFGALTVQYKLGQEAHEADWLIGKGVMGADVNGVALRSLKAPGTAYSDGLLGQDPQPYHMDLFVNTTSDGGGVHINSGIPNHAFYIYSMYMGGKAWERPGQIWYKALQQINNPMATIHDWAAQTMDAAIETHGIGSYEMLMLRRAWKLVGVDV